MSKNKNIETINLQKTIAQANRIKLIREVTLKHHTRRIRKIRNYLIIEHNTPISSATIARDLQLIKKEEYKKKRTILQSKKITHTKIKEAISETKKEKIPNSWLYCPLCGCGAKLPANYNASIGCNACSVYFDRDTNGWHYESTGEPVRAVDIASAVVEKERLDKENMLTRLKNKSPFSGKRKTISKLYSDWVQGHR